MVSLRCLSRCSVSRRLGTGARFHDPVILTVVSREVAFYRVADLLFVVDW